MMRSMSVQKIVRISNSCVFLLVLTLIFTHFCALAQPFPKRTRRVLFLGNSITYHGQYVNDVIAYLRVRYPDRTYQYINVGLPSETVSGLSEPNHADGKFPRPDLHERLHRVLGQTKPDLVLACYGMNDGIYMPFDSSRFEAFQKGMHWLHREVEKRGASIIHITPPVYDEENGGVRGYAEVLDRYSEWLSEQRSRQNWQVVDLHFPMKQYLGNQKKQNPGFYLAADGIHPGELGHWLMAQSMLRHLCGPSKEIEEATSIEDALRSHPNAKKILQLTSQEQQILKEAWLTKTGHTRPGIKPGLPLKQAQSSAKELQKKISYSLNH